MKKVLFRMWEEEDGVLSFEWVMLTTLLTLGIVGGIAGARDAIIDEFGDMAQAMLSVDQSYTVALPLLVQVHDKTISGAADGQFVDSYNYTDCDRLSENLISHQAHSLDTTSPANEGAN
jgi:Flp pilus assembly pilin Flp